MVNLLFISGGEIVVVGLVVLLLFGAKSIPDVARMLGKGMNEFRRASDEIKRELREQTSDVKQDINEVRNYINKEAEGMQKNMDADLSDNDPYQLKKQESNPDQIPDHHNVESKTTSDDSTEENINTDGPVSRETNIED